MAKQVFVRNLPFSVTKEELEAVFAEVGKAEAKILVDHQTGRAKGSAIVTFENDDDAGNAISTLNGRDFGGRDMVIEEARERTERAPVAPNKKLFVNKLAYGVTSELLEQTFAEAGEVERVHVATDENGQSRGFGFVTMGSVEAAQQAVDLFDGKKELMGWTLAVRFAEDKPREQRTGGNDRGGFGGGNRGGFGGGNRGGFGGGNRGGSSYGNGGGNRGGGRRDSGNSDYSSGYDQF
jgi:RNA recognition motif-containing protein